jgi:hypothetical protein
VFADQDLLAAATKPVKTALAEAPTDLPSGLEDKLPSFKPIFVEDGCVEDSL